MAAKTGTGPGHYLFVGLQKSTIVKVMTLNAQLIEPHLEAICIIGAVGLVARATVLLGRRMGHPARPVFGNVPVAHDTEGWL